MDRVVGAAKKGHQPHGHTVSLSVKERLKSMAATSRLPTHRTDFSSLCRFRRSDCDVQEVSFSDSVCVYARFLFPDARVFARLSVLVSDWVIGVRSNTNSSFCQWLRALRHTNVFCEVLSSSPQQQTPNPKNSNSSPKLRSQLCAQILGNANQCRSVRSSLRVRGKLRKYRSFFLARHVR